MANGPVSGLGGNITPAMQRGRPRHRHGRVDASLAAPTAVIMPTYVNWQRAWMTFQRRREWVYALSCLRALADEGLAVPVARARGVNPKTHWF